MNIILMFLAISGISFTLQHVEGPFDIISKIRNLLARIPLLGPMFFRVLSCNFCLGFWSSIFMYVMTGGKLFALDELMLWGFGGGMFNMFFNKVMEKLNVQE